MYRTHYQHMPTAVTGRHQWHWFETRGDIRGDHTFVFVFVLMMVVTCTRWEGRGIPNTPPSKACRQPNGETLLSLSMYLPLCLSLYGWQGKARVLLRKAGTLPSTACRQPNGGTPPHTQFWPRAKTSQNYNWFLPLEKYYNSIMLLFPVLPAMHRQLLEVQNCAEPIWNSCKFSDKSAKTRNLRFTGGIINEVQYTSQHA